MSEHPSKESKQQLPKIAEILDLPKPPNENIELATALQNEDLPLEEDKAENYNQTPADALGSNLASGGTNAARASKRDVIKVNTNNKQARGLE